MMKLCDKLEGHETQERHHFRRRLDSRLWSHATDYLDCMNDIAKFRDFMLARCR